MKKKHKIKREMVDSPKRLKRAPRLDLNPSAAERWVTCTASPQFILDNWDRVPADDSTRFNEEGTTAHEVAAATLEGREPAKDDKYKCPTPIDGDMLWHGWNYAEYVQSLLKPGGKLLVEQKLPLWYMPERNAIVDAAVINQSSIHVIDYKYGEGIIVSPVNNLQATIYAQSVIRQHWPQGTRIPKIVFHIFQPRGRASEDGFAEHTWTIESEEDFMTWGDLKLQIDNAAKVIQDKNEALHFAPSPKACQWCPAKGFCRARHEHFSKDVEALQVIPAGSKHLMPAKAISVQQLAAIIKHKGAIEKWLNDAYGYALQVMSEGQAIPGLKLVTSRGGNRYWTNPKQAAKLLLEKTHLRRDEVIEEKVIGPAGAEKLLGKNKFSAELTSLINRPPGKPVITTEDDPRESALIDGETEFTEEEI